MAPKEAELFAVAPSGRPRRLTPALRFGAKAIFALRAQSPEPGVPAKPGQAGAQPVLAPEAGRRLATLLSGSSLPKRAITREKSV
jgi:hypothetical protein